MTCRSQVLREVTLIVSVCQLSMRLERDVPPCRLSPSPLRAFQVSHIQMLDIKKPIRRNMPSALYMHVGSWSVGHQHPPSCIHSWIHIEWLIEEAPPTGDLHWGRWKHTKHHPGSLARCRPIDLTNAVDPGKRLRHSIFRCKENKGNLHFERRKHSKAICIDSKSSSGSGGDIIILYYIPAGGSVPLIMGPVCNLYMFLWACVNKTNLNKTNCFRLYFTKRKDFIEYPKSMTSTVID